MSKEQHSTYRELAEALGIVLIETGSLDLADRNIPWLKEAMKVFQNRDRGAS